MASNPDTPPAEPAADNTGTPEMAGSAGVGGGALVVISGPSGVGKTTITRSLQSAIAGAAFSVSVTTRAKTAKDTDGVDYHFVNDEAFDRLVAGGELLEWADVFGKRYGTPRRQVDEHLAAGRVVLLEIDVEGAKQVKRAMPGALAVFILPPSEDELLARLRGRGREDEAAIGRRFAEAQREIAEAESCGAYDVFVVNRELDAAVREAVGLVARHRAEAPG